MGNQARDYAVGRAVELNAEQVSSLERFRVEPSPPRSPLTDEELAFLAAEKAKLDACPDCTDDDGPLDHVKGWRKLSDGWTRSIHV